MKLDEVSLWLEIELEKFFVGRLRSIEKFAERLPDGGLSRIQSVVRGLNDAVRELNSTAVAKAVPPALLRLQQETYLALARTSWWLGAIEAVASNESPPKTLREYLSKIAKKPRVRPETDYWERVRVNIYLKKPDRPVSAAYREACRQLGKPNCTRESWVRAYYRLRKRHRAQARTKQTGT